MHVQEVLAQFIVTYFLTHSKCDVLYVQEVLTHFITTVSIRVSIGKCFRPADKAVQLHTDTVYT